MHSLKAFLMLLLVTVISCVSSGEVAEDHPRESDLLAFKGRDRFARGEDVRIQVENRSRDTLHLYKPKNLIIHKKQKDGWKRIRTLYCPCGASCPAPPEKLPLKPGGNYTYTWDQKEKWCGEMTAAGIPRMHRQFPGNGTYRLTVRYLQKARGPVQTLYKPFTIHKN
jgi:hypothetical protein